MGEGYIPNADYKKNRTLLLTLNTNDGVQHNIPISDYKFIVIELNLMHDTTPYHVQYPLFMSAGLYSLISFVAAADVYGTLFFDTNYSSWIRFVNYRCSNNNVVISSILVYGIN